MMNVSVVSACFNVFVRGRFYKLPWPRKPSPSPPNFRLRVSLGKRNLLYTAAHCTSFKQLHDTYKVRSVSVRCEMCTKHQRRKQCGCMAWPACNSWLCLSY